MNAYEDRIAETERVKERKRARVERGAGDVPGVPENRDAEQMAVRHADASGGDIRENQHEEDRKRDIHVGKRGSEAAGEEQPDNLRKTVRFVQEAPSVQKWGHVDDDVQISALDAFYEMDGRKSRYIGEVLDWYRGEDIGDLKRSELNEFSSPKRFEWVKMNLDTGAAVNTFPLNFGPEGAGDGRF